MAAPRNPRTTREAVEQELSALGDASSPEALAALSLADRIDRDEEPGSAHGVLVRELRATMGDIRRASKSSGPSIFDQLAAKRAANERAASGS